MFTLGAKIMKRIKIHKQATKIADKLIMFAKSPDLVSFTSLSISIFIIIKLNNNMDYLTDLENELSSFTLTLFQGINEIQQKTEDLDQASRIKLINSLSSELLNSHTNVMSAVGRIPDEIFSASREKQEAEIKLLELKYQQSLSRLEKLKTQAKNVFDCLETNLDSL